MDLIWRSEKIIKFGAARKKIKFGMDLTWRFRPFCANCTKFLRLKIYLNKVVGSVNNVFLTLSIK